MLVQNYAFHNEEFNLIFFAKEKYSGGTMYDKMMFSVLIIFLLEHWQMCMGKYHYFSLILDRYAREKNIDLDHTYCMGGV